MGVIKKLFFTAMLAAVMLILLQMGVWDKSRVAYAVIGLGCVAVGAKMWLDW